jgi:hypothetical protein
MVADDRDGPPGGKLPPPPLERQADILLSPEEWELLHGLLDFSPKSSPALKRIMLRKR